MKKIPTLFERDWEGDRSRVLDVVNPECAWVIAGEGVPTRKWDGTAVEVYGGRLWKRYDAKPGRNAPRGWRPAQSPDPETGHWPGWLPVDLADPADKAFRDVSPVGLLDGTYELCGPKVNGNPECLGHHVLFKHGAWKLPELPRTYVAIQGFLASACIEGIVWHHPDGRMAKIKARDFGLNR